MSKKMTAVEWLVQELFNNGYFHYGIPNEIVNQAKAMEKEQIIDAWDNGFEEMPYKNGKHYYEETYEKE